MNYLLCSISSNNINYPYNEILIKWDCSMKFITFLENFNLVTKLNNVSFITRVNIYQILRL